MWSVRQDVHQGSPNTQHDMLFAGQRVNDRIRTGKDLTIHQGHNLAQQSRICLVHGGRSESRTRNQTVGPVTG